MSPVRAGLAFSLDMTSLAGEAPALQRHLYDVDLTVDASLCEREADAEEGGPRVARKATATVRMDACWKSRGSRIRS
jgi:hypothetical protein